MIEAEKTAVKLVLADWNMPEMNGLELVKRVRQIRSWLRMVVVMVTTETELDQMAAALEAGANEYVMKPFTKEILVEKLQMVGDSALMRTRTVNEASMLNKRSCSPANGFACWWWTIRS